MIQGIHIPIKPEVSPMNTITQIAQAMQAVMIQKADQLAQRLNLVKRKRKLEGGKFIHTLVFGFLANPEATYEDLSQMAATVGMNISPQGLEQRLTSTAAQFVQQVLMDTVEQVVSSRPAAVPILQRFQGVYLRDSSVIRLPEELAQIWSGVGDCNGPTAALKLQVEFNFNTGQLEGPVLQAGRTHDQKSPFQWRALPAGALRLADLGYFNLEQLAQDDHQGVYWLSRLKSGTVIYTAQGERLDFLAWLSSQPQDCLDHPVLVGAKQQLPCRLLAVRVSQEVAEQRRRRLREYARKKQVALSQQALALTEWTLLITNVPVELLSLQEALILIRVRWQVELLFKLWKSHARVDEWRSANPWRILCELYAKLIGVVILHWTCLTSLWPRSNRSLFKAARLVQKFALALALTLPDPELLTKVLSNLQDSLAVTCRIDKRKKHPSTHQLLLSVS